MKFYLCILIFLGMLGSHSLFAQPANWLWAKSGGGLKQDQSSSIAVDSIGEVFVTGYYQDSADFSGTVIHSSKGSHFFLAKYSSDGSLLWVQTSRLTGHSAGTGLCISQNKYLYLTGYFSDSLGFKGTILFSASGTSNLFLAKFDLGGNIQWAYGEAASGADLRKSVTSDRQGNAYLCGSFSHSARFDAVDLTGGASNIFIAKFDPQGTILWAKGFGSASTSNAGIGITLDRSENIILTGSFGDTVDFSGTNLTAKGTSDIFVAKYDADGKLSWVHQAGAEEIGEGVSVTTDANEDIYATGSFSGSATSVDCDGAGNIYIAKYSKSGIRQWMKCEGARGEESGNAITSDSSGFIYVTGGFDLPFDFGSGTLQNNGLIDAFIVKYNSSGTAESAEAAGGKATDFGTGLAAGRNGNLYLTGIFSDTCLLGLTSLQAQSLTDIFITKIATQSGVPDSHSDAKGSVSLFPNPAKSELNIKFLSGLNDNVCIELFSILGISVKKMLIPQSEIGKQIIQIPIADLPRGTYMYRITSSGNMSSGLIVISD